MPDATEFDGTLMTKREVLIAREKFETGVHWMYQRKLVPHTAWPGDDVLREAAAGLYPLPKVTRPRLLQRGGVWYRVNGDARLESQPPCWAGCAGPHTMGWTECETIPADFAVPIADLLANPTEECDAE